MFACFWCLFACSVCIVLLNVLISLLLFVFVGLGIWLVSCVCDFALVEYVNSVVYKYFICNNYFFVN